MSAQQKDCLVETEWLAKHLDAPDILVMDASWYLPGAERNPRAEFEERRIPGAVFFDIDEICDEGSDLPHMLPSTTKFASRMKKMGIGDGTRVVVYDGSGIYSAPRVWWMLRTMGHSETVVLNGGLPKWLDEGRPIEDGPPNRRTELHFTPRFNQGLVRDVDDLRALIGTGGTCNIVDARPTARFTGEEEEPRPGLRKGHIPGSRNVPYDIVLTPGGTMKSPEAIRAAFEDAGVDPRGNLTTSCGSGVTAAILALALARIGNPNAALYDGSWAEWGRDNGLPVETGPARD